MMRFLKTRRWEYALCRSRYISPTHNDPTIGGGENRTTPLAVHFPYAYRTYYMGEIKRKPALRNSRLIVPTQATQLKGII